MILRINMSQQSKINSQNAREFFERRAKLSEITDLDKLIKYLNS